MNGQLLGAEFLGDSGPGLTSAEDRIALRTSIVIERKLVAQYRRNNPAARAPNLFKFHNNGGSRKSMACVCCGDVGPTWCARYPKTKRAETWETEHAQGHVNEVLLGVRTLR